MSVRKRTPRKNENKGHDIKIIGVGGGGGNAVTHMFSTEIVGVDFAICNTDAQDLEKSNIPVKIQLGEELTDGKGAGNNPNVGRESCIESIDAVKSFLGTNTKMVFITAGMGGGTGTGAAPVIAKTTKEMGILTVGIVTLPFSFEGPKRKRQAMAGLAELKENVDSIVVISNDKLSVTHKNLPIREAFSKADDILKVAAKGIAEIITKTGYVNVDFEDVNSIMRDSGVAIMGVGRASGTDRAKVAVEESVKSPLLEDNNIEGGEVLLNISFGTQEATMEEVATITQYVQGLIGFDQNLIWGMCYEEELGEDLAITIIATNFNSKAKENAEVEPERVVLDLDDEEDKSKKKHEAIFKKAHDTGKSAVEVDLPVDEFVKQHNPHFYNFQEPYVREKTQEELELEARREELERIIKQQERFKNSQIKLNDPRTLDEVKKTPAYLRRKVLLDDSKPNSSPESNLSDWKISTDKNDDINIVKGNSFLHKTVD